MAAMSAGNLEAKSFDSIFSERATAQQKVPCTVEESPQLSDKPI